jgi:hypothetical protein
MLWHSELMICHSELHENENEDEILQELLPELLPEILLKKPDLDIDDEINVIQKI